MVIPELLVGINLLVAVFQLVAVAAGAAVARAAAVGTAPYLTVSVASSALFGAGAAAALN